MTWIAHHAEVLQTLAGVADGTFDAALFDPPYGLGSQPTPDEILAYLGGAELVTGDFMGKDWSVPSVGSWKAIFRALKPGGHVVVFAGPRTVDLISLGLRMAGFEIRDVITYAWWFGTGFPKSLDVSKELDRRGGVSTEEQAVALRTARELRGLSRETVAEAIGCTASSVRDWEEGRARRAGAALEWIAPSPAYREKLVELLGYSSDERVDVGSVEDRRDDGSTYGLGHSGALKSGGHTDESLAWEGYGTALKPAFEPIILARKPPEGTIADNVAKHGVGALNIGGCRIAHVTVNGGNLADNPHLRESITMGKNIAPSSFAMQRNGDLTGTTHAAGRWPSNVILSHHPACVPLGTAKIKAAPAWNDNRPPSSFTGAKTSEVHHADEDGTETVERWECVEGCPAALLDAQTGTLHTHGGNVTKAMASVGYRGGGSGSEREIVGNSGGASRFFYVTKASREERDLGCDHLPFRTAAETVERVSFWEVHLAGKVIATFETPGEAGLCALYEPGATVVESLPSAMNSPRTGAGRTSGARNHHPCVKPVDLCRWLATLLLPPPRADGSPRRLLVPYAGSGSEMIGGLLAGWDHVEGIERDAEFLPILQARVGLAATNPRAFEPQAVRKPAPVDARQTSLFGETSR